MGKLPGISEISQKVHINTFFIMKRKSYLNKIYGFEKIISASVIKHTYLYSSDFIKVVDAHMTFETGVRKQRQQVFPFPFAFLPIFLLPLLLLFLFSFHFSSLSFSFGVNYCQIGCVQNTHLSKICVWVIF